MNKIKELTAHLRLMVQRGDIVLKRKADDFDTALNQIDIASEAKNSNAITMNTGQLIQIFEESANWSIKGQQCMPKLRFIEVVSKLLSANNNAESMAPDGWIKINSEDDLPSKLCYCWLRMPNDMFVALYVPHKQCFVDNDGEYYDDMITHYQPITKPQPPKNK